MSILQGKGMYLWIISRVEGGDPAKIAATAKQAGLSHVLIKVAHGSWFYNVFWKDAKDEWHWSAPSTTKGPGNIPAVDHVPALVEELRKVGISPWGWHYIFGNQPAAEAARSIERVKDLGLDGFVVNAEKEFKFKSMEAPAREYMAALRKGLPNKPIALSTYRYPSYHRPFPFETFLEKCDLNMPQVYWVQSNNPAYQLRKSMAEYGALSVRRPYFPTGAAYKEHGWAATPEQVQEFMEACFAEGLPGFNFWEWRDARQWDGGTLWKPIREFKVLGDQPVEDKLPPWVASTYFRMLISKLLYGRLGHV